VDLLEVFEDGPVHVAGIEPGDVVLAVDGTSYARLIIDLRGNIGGGLGFARLAGYLCPGQILIGHRYPVPNIPIPKSNS